MLARRIVYQGDYNVFVHGYVVYIVYRNHVFMYSLIHLSLFTPFIPYGIFVLLFIFAILVGSVSVLDGREFARGVDIRFKMYPVKKGKRIQFYKKWY